MSKTYDRFPSYLPQIDNLSQDHVSQTPNLPTSGSINMSASQISNGSSIPSGFSPRDITSSEFSGSLQSAAIHPQSGTPSNHHSSISSTPANGEFTLDFHDGRVPRVQYRAVPSQYMTNVESNRKSQYEMPGLHDPYSHAPSL